MGLVRHRVSRDDTGGEGDSCLLVLLPHQKLETVWGLERVKAVDCEEPISLSL